MVNKKSKHKISDSQKKNDINKIKKSIINKISGGSGSKGSSQSREFNYPPLPKSPSEQEIMESPIDLSPTSSVASVASSPITIEPKEITSLENNPANKSEPTTEPKIKSKRYFDEPKKVHDFEAKYMQDSSIGAVTTNEYIFNNHLAKLTDFLADKFDFLKIPDLDVSLEIFKKIRNNTLVTNFSDQFSFIKDEEYLKEITDAIAKEPKHKVKIFKYNLYLFNIDNNIKTFINSYNLQPTADLDEQYEKFMVNVLGDFNSDSASNNDNDNEVLQYIDTNKFSTKSLYDTFNVKNMSTRPYIEMYIPKLMRNTEELMEELIGGSGELTKDIGDIQSLKKIKIKAKKNTNNTNNKIISENTESNDFTNIQNHSNTIKTNNDNGNGNSYWQNVTNERKTMYGFNSSQGFTGNDILEVPFSDKKVQDYFDKCNDLQIFYINKHIEIYELFKHIRFAIKNNLLLNDIILGLLDPNLFSEKDDNIVRLKNFMTDSGKLLESQENMLDIVKNVRGKSSVKQDKPKPSINNPSRPFYPEPEYMGSRGLSRGLSRGGASNAPVVPENNFTLTLQVFNDVDLQLLNDKNISTTFDNIAGADKYKEVGNTYQYNESDNNDNNAFITCNFSEFMIKLSEGITCKIIFGTKMISFNDYYFTGTEPNYYSGSIYINDNDDDNDKIKFTVKSINYKEKSITISPDEMSDNIDTDDITLKNYNINIPKLKRHYIFFKNISDYFTSISDKQIVYGKISNTTKPDIDLLMTYDEANANIEKIEGIFVNILTPDLDKSDLQNASNDEYTPEQINQKKNNIKKFIEEWKPKSNEDEDMKFMYVDFFIDNVESYRTLQLIKRIQLINDESLHNILNPEGKDSLDNIIIKYKKGITDGESIYHPDLFQDEEKRKPKKFNQNATTKNKQKWQNFTPINNSNFDKDSLYFNTSKFGFAESIKNSDKAQQTIYKCYDLQILYLIKHLEVVELFKLFFYFIDMLFKKVAVLLFVLALYKKKAYDKFIVRRIRKILKDTSKLLLSQRNVAGNLVGGAADVPEAVPKAYNSNSEPESSSNEDERSSNEGSVESRNRRRSFDTNSLGDIRNMSNRNMSQSSNDSGSGSRRSSVNTNSSFPEFNINYSNVLPPPPSSTLPPPPPPHKYSIDSNPSKKEIRSQTIADLKEEAKEINDLKENVKNAKDPLDREKHQAELDEKLAKVKLDLLLFQLSEKKTEISKTQEQMQLIGTLSELDSRYGEEITENFSLTNKYFEKQEPKLQILKNVINPKRDDIKKQYNIIETTTHKLQSGKCLGGICKADERVNDLEAVYKAYIAYFTDAKLFGINESDGGYNKYQLIETTLKLNTLEGVDGCLSLDTSNTTNSNYNTNLLKKAKCLIRSIDILKEAQHVYSENIDIGYLLDKQYREYIANQEDPKIKQDYIKTLMAYYELFMKLYTRLNQKYKQVTPEKMNMGLASIKRQCEQILFKIREKTQTDGMTNTNKEITNLLSKTYLSLDDNDATSTEAENIQKYTTFLKKAQLFFANINEINNIEKENDKINSTNIEEQTKFENELTNINIKPEAIKALYSNFILLFDRLKEEKQKLLYRITEILANFSL